MNPQPTLLSSQVALVYNDINEYAILDIHPIDLSFLSGVTYSNAIANYLTINILSKVPGTDIHSVILNNVVVCTDL